MVGEIGIPRHEYLYAMEYWEIVLISRGYQRRYSSLWSSTRWSTYFLMTAMRGSQYMRESGIYNPMDLLKLPWDKVPDESDIDNISDAEVERLRKLMEEENAKAAEQ